jgi:hypothetical protein
MRRSFSGLLMALALSGCGLSDTEIHQTQVPITQTAEWAAKDSYLDCLFEVLDDAQLMDRTSHACTSYECRAGIADSIEQLGSELALTCQSPPPCATSVRAALQSLITAIADGTRGPGPSLSEFESDAVWEYLLDSEISAHEWFYDNLNNSCLRRPPLMPEGFP